MSFEISGIIPVYNAEKFVGRAASTALFHDCVKEVILVEDHSPTNDWEVCKKIQALTPKRVKLVRTKTNSGAGATRNEGIKNASKNYIAFLDADDIYSVKRLANTKKRFLENSSTDVVYGMVRSFMNDDDTMLETSSSLNISEALCGIEPHSKGHIHLKTDHSMEQNYLLIEKSSSINAFLACTGWYTATMLSTGLIKMMTKLKESIKRLLNYLYLNQLEISFLNRNLTS